MDVQFFWSFVSIDLDEVRFWQTIRGFSAVAAYMEDYKTCTAKKTKKSVGLRKRLKRKKLNLEQYWMKLNNFFFFFFLFQQQSNQYIVLVHDI